ncbi:MAG: DUF433 domain-containing protein [Phycisphaerales bacterium]|nr:DUF433 domain-containing protein [Phycisphaerales bacterium]
MAQPEDCTEHIASDPAIHHGEPCINGTRVALSVIVGSVADGDTVQQILTSNPQITAEDIGAALRSATLAVHGYAVIQP